jgi:DNA-binding IscR family transcriptional regulator
LGGFEMLAAGRRASIRKVIEAIDGPIYLNICLLSGASCKRKTYCPAHPIWVQAQEAMLAVLDTSTVAELADRTLILPAQLSAQPAAQLAAGAAKPKARPRKQPSLK